MAYLKKKRVFRLKKRPTKKREIAEKKRLRERKSTFFILTCVCPRSCNIFCAIKHFLFLHNKKFLVDFTIKRL